MKTVSISGFGGSYEWACQRMLQVGMEYLKERPDFDWSGYKASASENQDAKNLDTVLLNDHELNEYGGGPTGAMHQAVVAHLFMIHKLTHDGWLKHMAQSRPPEDFFEFEGSMDSVPTTEFSRRMDGVKK